MHNSCIQTAEKTKMRKAMHDQECCYTHRYKQFLPIFLQKNNKLRHHLVTKHEFGRMIWKT